VEHSRCAHQMPRVLPRSKAHRSEESDLIAITLLTAVITTALLLLEAMSLNQKHWEAKLAR
jgi:hypothetical protein